MKKIAQNIRIAFAGFLTGLIAVLLFLMSGAVRTRSRTEEKVMSLKKETNDEGRIRKRAEAEGRLQVELKRAKTPEVIEDDVLVLSGGWKVIP